MPNYEASIDNLVQGDTRRIPWQITNVPAGGAVNKGWMSVKVSAADHDVSAKFLKQITTTIDLANGHITDVSLPAPELSTTHVSRHPRGGQCAAHRLVPASIGTRHDHPRGWL